jgi:hypothetical protein
MKLVGRLRGGNDEGVSVSSPISSNENLTISPIPGGNEHLGSTTFHSTIHGKYLRIYCTFGSCGYRHGWPRMRELAFLCDGILFLFLFRVVSVCRVQGTAADAIRETKGTNHNEVDRGQRRREMFLLIIKLLSVRRHEGCRFVTRMNTH